MDNIKVEGARSGWRVRYTEVHGRRYGLLDVALSDPEALLCMEGSGGARSYTATVCTFPGTNRDEEHARLIASAPDLVEALEWALAELDALSNRLVQFAYPQGMAMLGRENQSDRYIAARAALSKAGV